MKILLLSDTHFTHNVEDSELKEVLDKQIPLNEKLDQILKQENLSTYDFAVVCGDLVHEGTAEDYQSLKQMLQTKFDQLPLYFVLGNHDRKNQFYSGMFNKSSEDAYDYAMVYQDLHFIFLDSAKSHTHSGEFNDYQLAWLADELASNPLPKVIFQHHPIFGSEYFENFVFLEPNPIIDILQDHPVLAIFTGHTHSPAVHSLQGLFQYTTYALSFGIEKLADNSQAFTNTCGYSIIEIDNHIVTFAPRIINPIYQVYKMTDPEEIKALNQSYEQ
ncbi:metallophosphoesterase [Ignavigranum ruoffiae]|uniref:metallophosphoesterase family protein n=1 Tax=Ignavigranum ruoffiae TaxID=89093 RepID=UPI0023540BF9|nr:metallophosphoesterase [Ignavigranum ruoffiae]